MRRPAQEHVVAWIVPAVLILVALHQLHHATSNELSSWKGGGFGMFASLDSPSNRAVRLDLETDRGRIPAKIHGLDDHSEADETAFVNARALPDDRRMGHLAARVVEHRWHVVDGVARVDEARGAPGPGLVLVDEDGTELTVSGAEVRVYGIEYRRRGGVIEPRLLATYRFDEQYLGAGTGASP